uniref:Tubulin domain-containing protein n=1 Tax=Macrostomum lignano TaxID=282301 RepID=A0A1I8J262_9PLAT
MASSHPKSLMTVQVGQAGIQIGHAVWELFCLEHNISADGTPKLHCGDLGNVESVFVPTPKGRYFPRSLFVDTDPACVDEMRSGPYKQLFSSRQLLSDQVDAASNYTTGRYGYAKRLVPDTLERLRWMTEKADSKPTLCLVHSACGGTGSGFAVACLARMADELGIEPQNIIDLCVVPGVSAGQSSCELLNTALYLDESQDLTRQTVCVSNSAMFRLCNSQLQSQGAATFAHANRALAAAFSNLTATERLPGSSVGLSGILDSLLPFRHLRYTLLACAPFLTTENARTERPTAKSATAAVLELSSQFLDVDLRQGRHAAGFLLYRGDASLGEAQKLAAELTARGRVQFQDWAPTGFRTGVVTPPPVAPPGSGFADVPISATLLASHSGISDIFAKLAASSRKLQDRDMFVHNYEGAIVSLLNKTVEGSNAGMNLGAGGPGTNTDSDSQKPTSLDSASADNNSVRMWMNPPAAQAALASGGGRGELQNYRRRRLTSREPGSHATQKPQQQQQEQQQDEEEPQVSRTCALSDVFGVRVRLSSAIDYLQRVSISYAADSQTDAGDAADVDAAAVGDENDVIGATNGEEDGKEDEEETEGADEEDGEEGKQRVDNKLHVTINDVGGIGRDRENVDSNRSVSGQSAQSDSKQQQQQQQQQQADGNSVSAEEEPQVEPSQQSEQADLSASKDPNDPPANNANQQGELPVPSSRWCLRRRSKSRRPGEAAATAAAAAATAAAAGKHPAIAEAEKILMKYQRSLGGQ